MDIPRHILAVDFGSSHVCALIYTAKLQLIGKSTRQIPRDSLNGSYELDPEAVWECFCSVMSDVLTSTCVPPEHISCLGISVQRNGFLLWHRKSSKPYTSISTWEDSRCSDFVTQQNQSYKLKVLRTIGLVAYSFTGQARFKALASYRYKSLLVCIRLSHLLRENPSLLSDCRRGLLCYGCLETWLIWRLTGGAVFATDISCASASGMYDPFCCNWSGPILTSLSIPTEILPIVYPSSNYYGMIKCGPLQSPNRVPITGVIGDSQAATIAENCLMEGDTKITFGTGSFFNVVTGNKAQVLKGFYPVVGWALSPDLNFNKDSDTPYAPPNRFRGLTYLIEALHQNTGTVLNWLKHMEMFVSYDELEEMLVQGDNTDLDQKATSDGVYYITVPPNCLTHYRQLLEGSEMPPMNYVCGPDGLLIGINKSNLHANRQTAVRAVMESIAFITKQMLDNCLKEIGLRPQKLHVNGNVANSNWLMQRLANTINIPVIRSSVRESSCTGAAIIAGIGAGIWPDLPTALSFLRKNGDSIENSQRTSNYFLPQSQRFELLKQRYQQWSQLFVSYSEKME